MQEAVAAVELALYCNRIVGEVGVFGVQIHVKVGASSSGEQTRENQTFDI